MSLLTLVYQTDPGVVLTLGSDRVYFQVELELLELFEVSEGRMEMSKTYRRRLFLPLCIESVEFILMLYCSAIVRTGCYNCPGLRLCTLMYCCI